MYRSYTAIHHLCSIDNRKVFGEGVVRFVDVIWVSTVAVRIRQT